jgi:hypothetical protein
MGHSMRFTALLICPLLLSPLVTVPHQHDTILDDSDYYFSIAYYDQSAASLIAVPFDSTPLLNVTGFIASLPVHPDTLSFVSHGTRSPPA